MYSNVAVHIDLGSLYEYELPLNMSSFCVQFLFFATKTAKTDARKFWHQ